MENHGCADVVLEFEGPVQGGAIVTDGGGVVGGGFGGKMEDVVEGGVAEHGGVVLDGGGEDGGQVHVAIEFEGESVEAKVHFAEEGFFCGWFVGFVGVAKVFFREADEAPGIIELGLEGEDHLGAIDVVRDFLNPDARFVLDGVLETLLEFGRATEAVHDGGGHAVGGFDAAGAVAVEPEFFIALDAGGEGEDQSEEENAAHRLSVISYRLSGRREWRRIHERFMVRGKQGAREMTRQDCRQFLEQGGAILGSWCRLRLWSEEWTLKFWMDWRRTIRRQ